MTRRDRGRYVRASGPLQATIVRMLRVVIGGSKAGLWLSGRRGPPELFAVGVDRKMKILIAYDGSDGSDTADNQLRRKYAGGNSVTPPVSSPLLDSRGKR